MAIFPKFKITVAAILFLQKLWCWASFLLRGVILHQRSLPNVMRIRPSTAWKYHLDKIKNGGSLHLEFWSHDISGHIIEFMGPIFLKIIIW